MGAVRTGGPLFTRPHTWLPLCSFILKAGIVFGNVNDAGAFSIASGQSELDNARSFAQEKYNANPSNPAIQMAFARLIANGDSARGIYKRVIASKKASDSLKAEAYFRLACISYMSANYGKAETYCASACSLDKREEYERLHSRIAILVGHDSLGHSSTTRKIDSLQTVSDSAKKVSSAAEKDEKKTAQAAYYLQIAAFSTMENAQGLRKDLMRLFSNIVIKEGTSHGKNIFRVRIGPFINSKEAQAFGDSALAKNKISFRIVED